MIAIFGRSLVTTSSTPTVGIVGLGYGRAHIPAPARNFTWWSYRSPDFTRNDRGRRLASNQ